MKRLLAIVALVLSVAACATDTSFTESNGVCYRTRTEKAFGIGYSTSEVQTVGANCEGR